MSAKPSIGSNFRWLAASQGARIALQLGGLAVLARILPASDFGLIAMALVVTTFATVLRDMGTTAALIQKERITDDLTTGVFWFNLAIGILFGAAVAGAAPITARVFREPELTKVLLHLALVFPLSATGAVHRGLLERAGRFRTLATLETASAALGLTVAVFCALRGKGVHSLVWQSITTTAVNTGLLWVVSRWLPTLRWHWRSLREISTFSTNLVFFNILNYFIRNSDAMLIGRLLGKSDLGGYTVAYRVVLFPLQNLSAVLQRTLLPKLSRLQSDASDLTRTYLQTLGMVAAVAAPLMAGAWALRDSLVLTLLGEEWIRVAGLIAWLTVVGFCQALTATTGTLFTATGRTDILRNLGILGSVLIVGAFVVGLRWGVTGVAMAYAVVSVAWLAPPSLAATGLLGVRVSEAARVVWRPLLIGLAMALLLKWLDGRLTDSSTLPAVRLAVLIPTGAALYFLAARIFLRDVLAHLIRVANPSV